MSLKEVILENGETMTYRERPGGNKTIILVHGNMTSSKHWDVLMDVLDSAYTIYAIDLRGFGGSSYNNPVQSIQDLAYDVKGFVDALELKDFAMIGWSLGGTVAMQFDIDYPGCCQQLILLASGSTRGYPVFEMKDDGTFNLENRLQTLDDIRKDPRTIGMQYLYYNKAKQGLKDVWNAVIYTDNQPDDVKYEEYIEDMLTQRNLAEIYQVLNIFNISNHHNGLTEGTNEAASIHIPTLLLYGDRDYVVTEEMTQEIMEDMTDNVQFIRLKNTGHSPMVDDLEQLKTAIENFLE